MLAKLSAELPTGPDFLYEPKWDGMRCIVAKRPDHIEMWSRHLRPLARYFPELVDAFKAISRTFTLDGEIIVRRGGHMDFEALLLRLHPAISRVRLLAEATPATFVAFDLIELDGADLRTETFEARRRALEHLLEQAHSPIELSPITADPDHAREWAGSGRYEGVVAKQRSLPYRSGVRAMVKVKKVRTADCVVAGFRWYRSEPTVGSLLLGICDGAALVHVGLATGLRASQRKGLTDLLLPLATSLEGHPWEHGFPFQGGPVGRLPGAGSRWEEDGRLTWVPLTPQLVCEVAYDRLDGRTLRHPARFRRWRPDLKPKACTWDQFQTYGQLPA
jgi:ATP-dependent DNA ligase